MFEAGKCDLTRVSSTHSMVSGSNAGAQWMKVSLHQRELQEVIPACGHHTFQLLPQTVTHFESNDRPMNLLTAMTP